MKQPTYEKISKAAALARRYEPNWYLGWAGGCAIAGIIVGSLDLILIGVMYLFLANVARQRNDAERERDEWQDLTFRWQEQSGAWRGLSDAWQKAYFTEPRPQDKP